MRTTLPIAQAYRPFSPRWQRHGLHSRVPLLGASRAAASSHLRLEDFAALLNSGDLVIDACRCGVRAGEVWVPLARRPVLFALMRALAEAWPADVDRQAL